MKVLFVASRYFPNIFGGGEAVAQMLAEAVVARGHQVVVVSLTPKKRYETADFNGVRVHYLPVRNLYFFPSPSSKPAVIKAIWHAVDSYNPLMEASLGRILDSERPDVVNTHSLDGFSASAWRAVRKRSLPLVHTLHSHYLLCSRSTMFHEGKVCEKLCTACRIYTQPRRSLSNLVHVVIGVSQKVLERHIQNECFSKAEKRVVYNAFETPNRCKTDGGGENGRLRFGYLGRLDPAKGVDLLVRSFLQLPEGQAELRIAGCGVPAYEQELSNLIGGNPAIKMLGFVSPSEFLPQLDLAVLPSLCHDCAPLSVLESMGHGLPVIGSCRGGIPELMGEGTGWVFDPDEPEALSRAMLRAIQSRGELKAMREQAAKRSKQFSIEAMVNGYLTAYGDAIKKNTEKPQQH